MDTSKPNIARVYDWSAQDLDEQYPGVGQPGDDGDQGRREQPVQAAAGLGQPGAPGHDHAHATGDGREDPASRGSRCTYLAWRVGRGASGAPECYLSRSPSWPGWALMSPAAAA